MQGIRSQELPTTPELKVSAVESAWTRQLPDRLRAACSLPSQTHLRIASLTISNMSGLTRQRPRKDPAEPPEPPAVSPPPPSSSLPPAYQLHALDSDEQTEYEAPRQWQELQDVASWCGQRQQQDGSALLLLPHLLLPCSLFSGFVHQQPGGCLSLVDVTVRETGGDARTLRSADCSQDEFDRRLAELGAAGAEAAGRAEAAASVSLELQGTVTGLTAFRFDLFYLSPVRLSFSAIVRPSSVAPLHYMLMIANRLQPLLPSAPPARGGPVTWAGSLQAWLSERHQDDYAQHGSFNQRYHAMQADMRALTEAELAEISERHQQQSRDADAWERQRRQPAVELAARQSPNVRPLLCGLDDDSLCVRAVFHLADSASVFVIARGLEPHFHPDRGSSHKQPTLNFTLDTTANATVSNSSGGAGSSAAQAAKKLKAEGEAAVSQLPIHLPDVSAIFAYRRQRLYRPLAVQCRRGEGRTSAEEFVELLKGPLHSSAFAAAAAAAASSLSASHLVVDDFSLRFSSEVSESFCLVLSSAALRCPLLDCQLSAPRLQLAISREPCSPLINPQTGYCLTVKGDIVLPAASASSSSSPASAAAVRTALTSDKSTVAAFDTTRTLTVTCSSGQQLCALYDRLYARWLATEDSSARQTAVALPLADCLLRCLPALATDDSVAHSVECRMDAWYSRASALLLRRLQLVHSAPPGLQSSSPFRCVLSTKERFGQPDTAQQRHFSIAPLQQHGWAPLRDWVAACGVSGLLAALPQPVLDAAQLCSVHAVLKLDGGGQPSFIISQAACGPRDADSLVAVQLYSTQRDDETTTATSCIAVSLDSKHASVQLLSPLRSFALLRQSELLTPAVFPQLETAALGQALEPLCCFVYADTGGAMLGKEEVKKLEALIGRAMSDNGGGGGCLESIRCIGHQPAGAFLLMQPHLPDGQLIVSADRQSIAEAATDAASDASPAVALPEPAACSSLLPRLMAVPAVFHLVLDLLDMNDVAHALTVVCRSSKQQLAPLFPTAVMSARYWSLSAPARFQRWADPSPLHWQEPVLCIRRDRLVARRQLMERPARCLALLSLPVQYAAAVELQSRLNRFSIAVMRQPPFLVLPQLHEPPAALRSLALHPTPRFPHPALFTSRPDELQQLLLITPAFCPDQRPRELGSTRMYWSQPAPDSSWQTVVRLPRSAAGAAVPASYLQHDWLRNLCESRLDGDGDSVWSAYTGPVYAYEDSSRTAGHNDAQQQEAQEADSEADAGLRLTAEQANIAIASQWPWTSQPAPTVSLPVRLCYAPSLSAAPVVRHLPNIDGTKLHVYSSNIASCLHSKHLLDHLQQYREQWRQSAQRLQEDERQRQQAQHTAEEQVVVHERISLLSLDQEMDNAMSGEVIAMEQEQEEAGERALPAFRVCVPLQNLLLAQLGHAMQMSDDWPRSAAATGCK